MASNHGHREPSHRLRVAAAAFLAAGATLLVVLGIATRDAGGTPPDPNLGHKVTLCHAEGNGSWHTVTVDVKASGLDGGHDNDGGIHVSDIIPKFRWIDNKDVPHDFDGRNLETRFDGVLGSAILANGCVVPTPPPPADDLCRNLDGVQAQVPAGLVREEDGDCVEPPQVDACPNLAGVQAGVPEGFVVDGDGRCVEAGTETDVCPNLPGDQATIPDGYYLSGHDCLEPQPAPDDPDAPAQDPTDVCRNLPGVQATVPAGLVLEQGACVQPTVTGPDDAAGPDGDDDGEETPDTTAPDEIPDGEGTTPVAGAGQELPFTGGERRLLGTLGLALVAIGLLLELGHRRRSAG